MQVLVTGASGLLGTAFSPKLSAAGFTVTTHGNKNGLDVSGDLTQFHIAKQLIQEVRPDIIINLVAITNVDHCEREPNQAYKINIKVVENLVENLQTQKNTHFIQLSTDQVYSGNGPHSEENVTILNTYALSKYAGELAALRMPATIVRTNFFGPSGLAHRQSFSDWLIEKFKNEESFNGFHDVLFNPLSIDTLSKMLIEVVKQRHLGVFNIGTNNGMSKADFAADLAAHFKLDTACMTRANVGSASLTAARPLDMRMDCRRFEETFGMKLPTLKQEINSLEK